MIARWSIGVAIGTLLIAITSPLFVRSYVPRVSQAARGVRVLQPGARYRWRSEGYATTHIGALGMPGRATEALSQQVDSSATPIQIALWGDSQAEGACVADDDKIGSIINRRSASRIDVLNFARSGDDCNDWLAQIASLRNPPLGSLDEFALSIKMHCFLVVELSDWTVESDEHQRGGGDESQDPLSDKISAVLPAFVIQAGRNVLTSGTESTFSQLRFRPGPVVPDAMSSGEAIDSVGEPSELQSSSAMTERLSKQLARLDEIVDVPVLFLYCPAVPSVHEGVINLEDADDRLFQQFRLICRRHDFALIDYRPLMTESVRSGRWPRGFHNGQFGVGHYNALGNRLIANRLLGHDVVQRVIQSAAMTPAVSDSSVSEGPSQD